MSGQQSDNDSPKNAGSPDPSGSGSDAPADKPVAPETPETANTSSDEERQSYQGIAKYLPLMWFGVLVFALFWVVRVYSTWLWPASLALVLFIVARPLHVWLLKRLPASLAATIATLAVLVGLVLPITYIVATLIHEAVVLAEKINDFLSYDKIFELIVSSPILVEYFTADDFWWVNLPARYDQLVGEYGSYFELNNISSVLSRGSTILLDSISGPLKFLSNFFFMSVILLFLFKDGRRFAAFFYNALPFPDWMEKKVVETFSTDLSAVLKGNFLVAILQGCFVGLAFWFSGIGSSFLWGAVGSMVSVIPIIGTQIVFIPGSLYLIFLEGELGWGIFVFAFCMTTYQGLDLLLKPKLLDQKLGLHPLVLFLAILGGLSEFGIPGVVIGPLVVTVFNSIWEIAKYADDDMFTQGNG